VLDVADMRSLKAAHPYTRQLFEASVQRRRTA